MLPPHVRCQTWDDLVYKNDCLDASHTRHPKSPTNTKVQWTATHGVAHSVMVRRYERTGMEDHFFHVVDVLHGSVWTALPSRLRRNS